MYSVAGTDTVTFVPSDAEISPGRYLWNVRVDMAGGASVNSRTRGVVLSP